MKMAWKELGKGKLKSANYEKMQ